MYALASERKKIYIYKNLLCKCDFILTFLYISSFHFDFICLKEGASCALNTQWQVILFIAYIHVFIRSVFVHMCFTSVVH